MKQSRTQIYNIEYSGMNGLNWMLYCVTFSFAGVFLLGKGYTSTEMGVILAVANLLALPAQPILAQIADRSRKITLLGLLVIMLLFLAGTTVGIMVIPEKCLALAVLYALLLMGMQIIQPLVNSFSFYLASWGVPVDFGIARAMGSLGYAIISSILGVLVERMGILAAPGTALVLLAIFLGLMGILSVQRKRLGAVPAAKQEKAEPKGERLSTFFRRYPRYMVFLLGIGLIFAGHTFINNFLINLVRNVGGTDADMGTLYAVTAVLEMPGMLAFSRLLKKFRCQTLLKLTLVVFTVKLTLAWMAQNLAGLYISTFLQLIGYGLFIPASVQYANDVMNPGDEVKGQAFVTSMITVGAILSSLLGGRVIDLWGTSAALLMFLVMSVLGTVFALAGVEKKREN